MIFPTDPILNQLYSLNEKTWKWNGVGWSLVNTSDTEYAPISHIGMGDNAHPLATPTMHGFMSFEDKVKLNGIAAGATSNIGTVTAVNAGNGMTFASINGSGSVTLGTPGTLSGTTTNQVTSNSHTHALSTNLSAWDEIAPAAKFDYAAADDAGIVQWKTGSDLNVRYGSGTGVKFFRAINTTLNTPIPGSYFSVMQMTYDAVGGAQLVASVVAERMWFRRSPNATFVEVYHTGNLPVSVSGSDLSMTGVFQAQRIDSAQNYSTTGNSVALSPGTAGTVYLRPRGLGQTANQTTLDTNGNMVVGGSVSDTFGDVRKMKGRVSNASTTFAATDLNGVVESSDSFSYTYTLPAGLGSLRDAITIVNSGTSGTITITPASSVTLYQNGSSGSISVTAGSMVTIYRSNVTNRWVA